MNKPTLVKKVFNELLESIGSGHCEVELLAAAREIVEAVYDVTDVDPKFSISENARDLDSMDLHTAMTQDPWKVVRRESEMMSHFFAHQSGHFDNFVFGSAQYG